MPYSKQTSSEEEPESTQYQYQSAKPMRLLSLLHKLLFFFFVFWFGKENNSTEISTNISDTARRDPSQDPQVRKHQTLNLAPVIERTSKQRDHEDN